MLVKYKNLFTTGFVETEIIFSMDIFDKFAFRDINRRNTFKFTELLEHECIIL